MILDTGTGKMKIGVNMIKKFKKYDKTRLLSMSSLISRIRPTESLLGHLPFEKPVEEDFILISRFGDGNFFKRRLNYINGIFKYNDEYYLFESDLVSFGTNYGDKYNVIRIDPEIFSLTENYSPFSLFHYALLFEDKFWIINEDMDRFSSDVKCVEIYEHNISHTIYGGYTLSSINKDNQEHYTIDTAIEASKFIRQGDLPKDFEREISLLKIGI